MTTTYYGIGFTIAETLVDEYCFDAWFTLAETKSLLSPTGGEADTLTRLMGKTADAAEIETMLARFFFRRWTSFLCVRL